MTSENQPHILVASSLFLGICVLLVIGLELSGAGNQSFVDEFTILAMLFFLASCVMSYASTRMATKGQLAESIAVVSFVIGLLILTPSVIAFAAGAL